MLNPLDSRPEPRPSAPPARRSPDRPARDDAPAFTVRDEADGASDARPPDRAAASRRPERDGRTTSSTDRSATGTSATRSRRETERRSDDATVAASWATDETADAAAVPRSAGTEPGRIAGDPEGTTNGDTPADRDVAPVGTPAAMPIPAATPVPANPVLTLPLSTLPVPADPMPTTPVPIAAAGSILPRLPGGAADPDASAEPRATAPDATPMLAGAPTDPSVQASTTTPAADARPAAAASGESLKADESRKAGEALLQDAALPSATQPQPVALAVAAMSVPAVPPAAPDSGTGAGPMSGSSARSAARPAGRAATGPVPAGDAGPAGSGAPGGETGEVGAAAVVAKPVGAVATGEAVPSRPEGAIASEAGPQVSTGPHAEATDFATQLAQLANPAGAPAAQTLPAAAASAPGDAAASRTAAGVPIGDVPVEIGLRALDGSSRFDIRLSPEDLGRIDVKLDIDGDGRVRAHLVVDRPETLAFLQRDGDSLHRAFEQAGFKPSETGIAFSLRDPGQDAGGGRNGSGENGQRPQPPARAGQGREAGPDAVPTAWRTLQAGRAGIDLRI